MVLVHKSKSFTENKTQNSGNLYKIEGLGSLKDKILFNINYLDDLLGGFNG